VKGQFLLFRFLIEILCCLWRSFCRFWGSKTLNTREGPRIDC
jgi:hypothetical protein